MRVSVRGRTEEAASNSYNWLRIFKHFSSLANRNFDERQPKAETLQQQEVSQRALETVGMYIFTFEKRDYRSGDGRFFLTNYWEIDHLHEGSTSHMVIKKTKAQFARHGNPETVYMYTVTTGPNVCIGGVPGLCEIVECQPQDIESFAPTKQRQGRESSENCENHLETSKRCQD